ncbi:MAG: glycosyltransferase family 2 protein [Candidatus Korobacteraceae bacterium]|jgi:polyisoprenyl-phosphate glycosyltransferase
MQTQNSNGPLLQPRPYPNLLTLVIPMYNEGSVVPHLRRVLDEFMNELKGETEVVLVNDGSTDSTLGQIAAWAYEDPRIKVVNLSRNFGHQSAATAGLDYASGDAIILLDADLQDPVSVIHQMIVRYCEGYDVVYGQRITRQGDRIFKRLSAWLFYRLMHKLVYKDLPVDTGDFRLVSRNCLNGLQQLRETHRFLRGMVAWVGYPQIAVPYERAARVAGETKYPVGKMLTFAWTAATSFSVLPLKVSVWVGLIVTVFGLEEAVRATLAHIFHWYAVPGWSSLTVLVSVLGGATLMSIGVLGEYVGKIYEQAKNRPLYLVSRTFNIVEPSKPERASELMSRSEYR